MTVLIRKMLSDVHNERIAQLVKWGEQSHPDGTGSESDKKAAAFARELTDSRAEAGDVTWRDILREEVAEAFAESDPARLDAELTQVAAVAVAWKEDLAMRSAEGGQGNG